jgi:quercetin dioxygenase-like cupin family protein
MSLHHAHSGEPIDVRPLGPGLAEAASTALVRTDDLEVMRLVLLQGKSIPEHQTAGEITLQCLEGEIEVSTDGRTQPLRAGQMLLVAGRVPYAVHARTDASVLMTVLRKEEAHKDSDED